MDAVVAAALEEISLEGSAGCTLPTLWGALQRAAVPSDMELDAEGKQMIWQALVNVPGLVLLPSKPPLSQQAPVPVSDPAFRDVADVERLGLAILAPESLREGCLGVYDVKYSDARLSDIQREVLERLAVARYKGVTQNDIGREFKKGGNAMFYVMRNLEVRGLVVRQSTIVRSKDAEHIKNSSIVATNLVHLTRFAKNHTLNSHQRFEISKPSGSLESGTAPFLGDAFGEEESGPAAGKTYVVNDDFPAMKNVCDKLEQAADKVLVVSDLKLALGYRLPSGHRTWRRLVKRLQDAGLVEVFSAQIDRKVVTCIRLLKSFDAKVYSGGKDDSDCDVPLRAGKRGQVTEQLTELPIDRQIHDLIDQSGPEGLQMMEVLKRLGLHNKRNYFRVTNMMARQTVVSEAETHRRSTLYRLRTPRHALASSADLISDVQAGSNLPSAAMKAATDTPSTSASQEVPDRAAGKSAKVVKGGSNEQVSMEQTVLRGTKAALSISDSGVKEVSLDFSQEHPADLSLPASVEHPSQAVPEQPRSLRGSHQYPCSAGSRTNIQRELRIYQKLKAETFILRIELHRWLEDIEGRKGTSMDRKTLTRALQKLLTKGHCKIVKLSMPGLTNCNRNRETEVILLPEVEITADVVTRLHERVRQFDTESRGQCLSRAKKLGDVPVLEGVKRMTNQPKPKPPTIEEKPLQVNGFIPAKLVRVRMLYYHLWSYVNGLPEFESQPAMENENATSDGGSKAGLSGRSKTFTLWSAVHGMPLELYLQVVGSKKAQKVAERCKQGLRISDIPKEEQNTLMENNSSSRLSWLVDVLRRLKLIRLEMGHGLMNKHMETAAFSVTEASLAYALELHPFIEEPVSQSLPSLGRDFPSPNPVIRHNFTMSSKEELDAYWQTLEYFFSGADPSAGKCVFPGSKVPEVFGLRSWTSLRIMTIEQRTELLKRVGAGGLRNRMSAQECARIAKDLHLELDQVLRVSYEKNRRFRLQELAKTAAEGDPVEIKRGVNNESQTSRKRAALVSTVFEPAHVRAFKKQRQLLLEAPTAASQALCLKATQEHAEGSQLQQEEDEDDEDELEGNGQAEAPFNHVNIVASLKPLRSKRFPWSDRFDRILIACYAKQRAILGARHQRVDWGTITGLPAPPVACRRRMIQLRADPSVRKAVLSFCSLLAARYSEFLAVSAAKGSQADREQVAELVSESSCQGLVSSLESPTPSSDSGSQPCAKDPGIVEKPADKRKAPQWNIMEDSTVLLGLEEVMRCKIEARAKRLAASIGRGATKNKFSVFQSGLAHGYWLDDHRLEEPSLLQGSAPEAPKSSVSSLSPSKAAPNIGCNAGASEVTGKPRMIRVRARSKQLRKPLSLSEPRLDEIVQRSLQVANAVELVKLAMLNSGLAFPQSIDAALMRFRSGDVITAVNYLRKYEFVAVGHDRRPFILSAKFHLNCSASRFPAGTGEESQNVEAWLKDHNEALHKEWVTLSSEQTCGQLLHLFGLVAVGELVLAPFMPEEGIGESADYTNMVTSSKRKADSDGDQRSNKPRLQPNESQFSSLRRERGYPGISVGVRQTSLQSQDIVTINDALTVPGQKVTTPLDSQSTRVDVSSRSIVTGDDCTASDSYPLLCASKSAPFVSVSPNESKNVLESCIHHWCFTDTEPSTAQRGLSVTLQPECLTAAFHAIEEANQGGLRMEQLRDVINKNGSKCGEDVNIDQAEAYFKALQSFNLVQKVNAFDHVRILTTRNAAQYQVYVPVPTAKGRPGHAGPQMEETIVNSGISSTESKFLRAAPNVDQATSKNPAENVTDSRATEDGQNPAYAFPIRPWFTADGSMNPKFLKAMTRRVMGMVMLSPGITEEHLVANMEVLNPQSARDFLDMLEAEGHLSVRARCQLPVALPTILSHLIKAEPRESSTRVKHYFPNILESKLL